MFPLWLYNTCRTMAGREARKRLHVEASDYDLPDSQHQRGEIDHILEAPPVEYYVEQQCAPCAEIYKMLTSSVSSIALIGPRDCGKTTALRKMYWELKDKNKKVAYVDTKHVDHH